METPVSNYCCAFSLLFHCVDQSRIGILALHFLNLFYLVKYSQAF